MSTNIIYPIQIIKYLEDLNKYKKSTIVNSFYKESYKC